MQFIDHIIDQKKHYHSVARQCVERSTSQILWRLENFGGSEPQTPVPIDKIIGVGDYVGDNSSHAMTQ